MNVAAKITSLTDPNKVSVGENVYKLLHPGIQAELQVCDNFYLLLDLITRTSQTER
jgi:hypothetical protein